MQAISLESLECIELQRRRHEGDCHISGKASNSVTHETQSLVASCDPESYASKRDHRGAVPWAASLWRQAPQAQAVLHRAVVIVHEFTCQSVDLRTRTFC